MYAKPVLTHYTLLHVHVKLGVAVLPGNLRYFPPAPLSIVRHLGDPGESRVEIS